MAGRILRHAGKMGLLLAAGLALAACQSEIPKELTPVPNALKSKMQNLAMNETAPIYIRIFKEESQLEVWKQRRDGKYGLLKTYDICKWSGELGPKKVEGDRQAPEGFYTVAPGQMNPNSSYYLSFNIGYPNAFDQAHGRTGKHLMVHGACSSAGCYSMTDEQVAEIFALARDAFRGGQPSFQVHAFPFRMTAENMARHRDNQNLAFWQNLKRGYDHFEVTQVVPSVDVCSRKYVFDATPKSGRFEPTAACPAYDVPEPIATAVAAKEKADEAAFQVAVAKLERDATPAAGAAATTVAAAATTTAPAARPAEPEGRSLLSRIFGRGAEPEAPAPAAAYAAPQATAPEAVASGIPLPQARPRTATSSAVAAAAPVPAPAPAPARAAAKPAAAPAAAPAAPQPVLRPTVAETPAQPQPTPPRPTSVAAAEPAPSAAATNFDSRFLVPVPVTAPQASSTMKGAAPTVSTGLTPASGSSATQ